MSTRESNQLRWERVVAEFEQSGLSCAAFAKQRRIGRDGLKYWWRTLRPGVPMLRSKRRATALIPVQVAGTHTLPAPPAAPLQLLLPSGIRLQITEHTEPGWIGRLVAALTAC